MSQGGRQGGLIRAADVHYLVTIPIGASSKVPQVLNVVSNTGTVMVLCRQSQTGPVTAMATTSLATGSGQSDTEIVAVTIALATTQLL